MYDAKLALGRDGQIKAAAGGYLNSLAVPWTSRGTAMHHGCCTMLQAVVDSRCIYKPAGLPACAQLFLAACLIFDCPLLPKVTLSGCSKCSEAS